MTQRKSRNTKKKKKNRVGCWQKRNQRRTKTLSTNMEVRTTNAHLIDSYHKTISKGIEIINAKLAALTSTPHEVAEIFPLKENGACFFDVALQIRDRIHGQGDDAIRSQEQLKKDVQTLREEIVDFMKLNLKALRRGETGQTLSKVIATSESDCYEKYNESLSDDEKVALFLKNQATESVWATQTTIVWAQYFLKVQFVLVSNLSDARAETSYAEAMSILEAGYLVTAVVDTYPKAYLGWIVDDIGRGLHFVYVRPLSR